MSQQPPRRPGQRSRIGAWRLVDLVQAITMTRAGMLTGGGILPEYGPPDWQPVRRDPEELPESNVGEPERRAAVERERTRRWLAMRSEQPNI